MSLDNNGNVTLLHGETGDLPQLTKVLVLEDDKIDQETIRRAAAKSNLDLDFVFSETLERFANQINAARFDLAILDFHLPDGTGLEALRLIGQSRLNRKCAAIMIAREAEISVVIAAMKSGCSDYIIKEDLTPATLRRAIVSAMQKSVLREKVTQAGRKLVTLSAALREHGEVSASIMRPLLNKTLTQLSAVELALAQSGQTASEARLGIISENCRLMEKLCKGIEQDAELAHDDLDLSS